MVSLDISASSLIFGPSLIYRGLAGYPGKQHLTRHEPRIENLLDREQFFSRFTGDPWPLGEVPPRNPPSLSVADRETLAEVCGSHS